jgi:putative peptidoglycan lipid II flippase
MLNKLLLFEQKFSISKAATIVGVFAMLSKLVALIRDPLFASTFGGNKIYILDIYNAAFRVPDFIFNIFILGTLSVAFIPVFVELLTKDAKRAAALANTIITLTMSVMGGIFFLLFLFARPITAKLVPGFSADMLKETVGLTRLIILSQIIFTLSNICSNVLYSYKRFVMAGIAPILYNVGIILGIIWLYPRFGIIGLGYGVLAGAMMHLLIQLPEMFRSAFYIKPQWQIHDPAIKKFLKLYIPRIFAIDLSVFSLLVGTFIASNLQSGSIAIFTLSMNLLSIPVSIIALSLATAVFPALSEAYAENNEQEYLSLLKKTLVQIFYFMIPATLLMLVFRAQGVRLYLGHGNFTWENTILTFNTFGVLAFCVLGQSLTPLLARAFYSRQNTKTPVVVNLLSLALNAMLAFVLGKSFGILGIAAAFAVASLFNAFILFILLRSRLHKTNLEPEALRQFDSELFTVIGKIMLASMAMGSISYGGLYLFEPYVNTHTNLGLLIQSGGAGIAGLVVFFVASSLLNLRESQIILDYLKKVLGNLLPSTKLS